MVLLTTKCARKVVLDRNCHKSNIGWSSTLVIFLSFLFLVAILELVSAYKSGAQFRLPHHPHTHWKNWRREKHSSKNKCYHLPCPAVPSTPSSHSNLNHNPENNTGRLKKTTQNLCNEHSSSTPKQGGGITEKKIKKPENKKVERRSAEIQKPRSAKTKRKIAQRTHTHAPPTDDDDRLPTQRASNDTDPRHPMTFNI